MPSSTVWVIGLLGPPVRAGLLMRHVVIWVTVVSFAISVGLGLGLAFAASWLAKVGGGWVRAWAIASLARWASTLPPTAPCCQLSVWVNNAWACSSLAWPIGPLFVCPFKVTVIVRLKVVVCHVVGHWLQWVCLVLPLSVIRHSSLLSGWVVNFLSMAWVTPCFVTGFTVFNGHLSLPERGERRGEDREEIRGETSRVASSRTFTTAHTVAPRETHESGHTRRCGHVCHCVIVAPVLSARYIRRVHSKTRCETLTSRTTLRQTRCYGVMYNARCSVSHDTAAFVTSHAVCRHEYAENIVNDIYGTRRRRSYVARQW